MRQSVLCVALLVLLSGCGGLSGDPTATGTEPPAVTDAPDEVRYGIAVENEFASNQTVRVRISNGTGSVVVNRSRRLAADDLWHVTTLRAANYGTEPIRLEVLVGGDLTYDRTFNLSESASVEQRAGAKLVVIGESTTATYECAGSVACYRQVATDRE